MGCEWDKLFLIDHERLLQDRMERAVDGDYQMYSVSNGKEVREHWVRDNPKLARIMQVLSDEEIRCIRRGGHDHRKIYAAFKKAMETEGLPSVIRDSKSTETGLIRQVRLNPSRP